MLKFRPLAASSRGRHLLRYLTEATPAPIHPPGLDAAGRQLEGGSRLVDYYTGRDSRATWRPDMPPAIACALGIDPHRAPTDAGLVRLFEARRADTGRPWSPHRRKISAYDLVFSVHKSVSLAAEFAATPAESAALWHAIDRANDAAMRYVGEALGWARRGAGGRDGAEPGAVGWVSFRHHTARPTLAVQDGPDGPTLPFEAPVAGDPHAHIHNALFNLVATRSGHLGSLDSLRLHHRVLEFGAVFQAVLADELRRLGARIGYDEGEQAVVLLAIPEPVCAGFSKRERQVLREARAFAESQGLVWDQLSTERKLALTDEASAAGRLGKLKADERAIWRAQAAEQGWQHTTVLEGVRHAPLPEAERLERAYAFAARKLAEEFETAAVLDHDVLRRYAARGLIGTGIGAAAADIERVVGLLEARGLTVRGEPVRLILGQFDEKVRVTHTAQVRIEQAVQGRARRAAADRSGALDPAALRQAIAGSGVLFTPGQVAAIHALGESGALTMLTGAAGAGKTTLLQPLVAAWRADRRFSAEGREVIGAATAWRQADALRDAGIDRTCALQPLLRMLEAGEIVPSRNTVLVLDEVSQIAPRPMLQLLEVQARTGMTLKLLGDREQAQAIEAGDTIELLLRALPREAMPELLATVRQRTREGQQLAALFRDGRAAEALERKRDLGTARLVGGDYDQVLERIAELYLQRRDLLRAAGDRGGITISAPSNAEVADLSRAIRQRLRARGEIGADEVVYRAIDQRGETYDLPIATGDRLRLFRRTWGRVGERFTTVGNNGDVVTVAGRSAAGLRLLTADGRMAEVEWRRLLDASTGRLLLGFGHALTIDAAQGITSTEHINALAKGTGAVTGFKTYVAESRSRCTTWTLISEAAVREAEQRGRALGDITPVTVEDLWARAAEDMGAKPYKTPGIDVLRAALADRAAASEALMAAGHRIETALLADPGAGEAARFALQARLEAERLGPDLGPLLEAASELRAGDRARLHPAATAEEAARPAARPRLAPAAGPAF